MALPAADLQPQRLAREIGPPFVASWPLAPGEHVLTAVAEGGARSEPVAISVE